MIFRKIKISLMHKISIIFGIIFRQRSYVRILILILLDIFLITSSLLISSVLLSIKNLYYFSYQDYKLLFFLFYSQYQFIFLLDSIRT